MSRDRGPRAHGGPLGAVLIGLGSLCIYLADGAELRTADSIPNTLVPLAVTLHGTTALDPFADWLGVRDAAELAGLQRSAQDPPPFYYLVPARDRIRSAYPPALPLLLAPLYGAVAYTVGADRWTPRMQVALALRLESVTAALIAATAAAVLFGLLGRLTTTRWALVLTALFALGTAAWTTASVALWQQGAGTLLLLLTLRELAADPPHWPAAGAWAALALAIRPTNLLLWLAVVALLLHRRRWDAVRQFAIPGLLLGLLIAGYNVHLFGDLRGGYAAEPLRANPIPGLIGLLTSPSRGLLVYSPALALALPGALLAARAPKEQRLAYGVAAAFVALSLLIHAHLERWWGGASYGPRLLAETAAALVVLMAPLGAWIRGSALRAVGFAALLTWGVAVQAAGALCYRLADGEARAAAYDAEPERFTTWRDAQVLRALRACAAPASP